MSVRFSVIIPAYNEARLLPRLLDSIEIAATKYGRDQIEVIVADNLSTDDTRAVAESKGCRVVSVTKRRIAAARNGGANISNGEILCFIDADSAMHPDTFYKIDEAMHNDNVIAGATGVFLERRSIGLMATYLMMLPMLWLTGMVPVVDLNTALRVAHVRSPGDIRPGFAGLWVARQLTARLDTHSTPEGLTVRLWI